jgi:hypothetical protein
MKTLSFLAALMVLWLAVTVLVWLFYRIFRRRDGLKQERLLGEALCKPLRYRGPNWMPITPITGRIAS